MYDFNTTANQERTSEPAKYHDNYVAPVVFQKRPPFSDAPVLPPNEATPPSQTLSPVHIFSVPTKDQGCGRDSNYFNANYRLESEADLPARSAFDSARLAASCTAAGALWSYSRVPPYIFSSRDHQRGIMVLPIKRYAEAGANMSCRLFEFGHDSEATKLKQEVKYFNSRFDMRAGSLDSRYDWSQFGSTAIEYNQAAQELQEGLNQLYRARSLELDRQRISTIGSLVTGFFANSAIDSILFKRQLTTGRTALIDMLAPAVIFAPDAKYTVNVTRIVGAHTLAKLLDCLEQNRNRQNARASKLF